ncbi:hypothetical protein BgiBS90_023499, partial [Biomphalaria glabrata]
MEMFCKGGYISWETLVYITAEQLTVGCPMMILLMNLLRLSWIDKLDIERVLT